MKPQNVNLGRKVLAKADARQSLNLREEGVGGMKQGWKQPLVRGVKVKLGCGCIQSRLKCGLSYRVRERTRVHQARDTYTYATTPPCCGSSSFPFL